MGKYCNGNVFCSNKSAVQILLRKRLKSFDEQTMQKTSNKSDEQTLQSKCCAFKKVRANTAMEASCVQTRQMNKYSNAAIEKDSFVRETVFIKIYPIHVAETESFCT